MNLRRIGIALCGLGLAVAGLPGVAIAQDYPNKPLRLVVPYDTGGISDLIMRMIQPKMVPILGQPIIIRDFPLAVNFQWKPLAQVID